MTVDLYTLQAVATQGERGFRVAFVQKILYFDQWPVHEHLTPRHSPPQRSSRCLSTATLAIPSNLRLGYYLFLMLRWLILPFWKRFPFSMTGDVRFNAIHLQQYISCSHVELWHDRAYQETHRRESLRVRCMQLQVNKPKRFDSAQAETHRREALPLYILWMHIQESHFQCFQVPRYLTSRENSRTVVRTKLALFFCDFSGCGFTTTRSGTLAQHRKRHHIPMEGETGLVCTCSVCGYGAKSESRVRAHISQKHVGNAAAMAVFIHRAMPHIQKRTAKVSRKRRYSRVSRSRSAHTGHPSKKTITARKRPDAVHKSTLECLQEAIDVITTINLPSRVSQIRWWCLHRGER